MARADIEVKGEIIAELEDIEDPGSGKNLLDALMVEQVEVSGGEVTITLTFAAERSKEERWAIEESIYDALEELDGIEDLNILSMMSKEEAAPAPSAPEAVAASEGRDSGLSVYSGGGCSAGTQQVVPAVVDVVTQAAPAPLDDTSTSSGQEVTVSLAEYRALIQAQRDNQHLKERVLALQEALRALLSPTRASDGAD